MNHHKQQRLYWSISRPLKYMGLTIDEMVLTISGIGIAVFCLMDGMLKLSLGLFIATTLGCYFLKKYKNISQGFKLKSFLVSKHVLPAPKWSSKLNQKEVGK